MRFSVHHILHIQSDAYGGRQCENKIFRKLFDKLHSKIYGTVNGQDKKCGSHKWKHQAFTIQRKNGKAVLESGQQEQKRKDGEPGFSG